jgi:hypothetical protein
MLTLRMRLPAAIRGVSSQKSFAAMTRIKLAPSTLRIRGAFGASATLRRLPSSWQRVGLPAASCIRRVAVHTRARGHLAMCRRAGVRRACAALLALSLAACAGAKGGTPPLHFAFVGGALYARLTTEWEDRGDHALYTLLQLARRGGVPDVRGALGAVAGDTSGAADGATLSFWRPANATTPLLWPDHDFSGWASAWIAPHDALAAALDADAPPWAKRRGSVYWTGALVGGELRPAFAACAAAQPAAFTADVIDWSKLRARDPLPFAAHRQALKPLAGDLRRMTAHKYVVYLWGRSWSSSLKRLALAGAALLVPASNPFESFVSQQLAECAGCVVEYDASDPARLCAAIADALRNVSDAEAAQRAARLGAFVRQRLRHEDVLRFAKSVLDDLVALNGQLPAHELEGDGATLRIRGQEEAPLRRVDCAAAKTAHRMRLGHAAAWQVDAWLDDDCEPHTQVPYLKYVAL